MNPLSPSPRGLFGPLLAVALLALPSALRAFNPGSIKYSLPASALATEGTFGATVAGNDTYVVVGDPTDTRAGAETGAAHVFDRRRGRYLRRLVPLDAGANARFGESIAVEGHLAVVGASTRQAAYVFDLRTGRQLHRLEPGNGQVGAAFGRKVAISGRYCLVAAPGQNAGQGEAYLFDLSNLVGGMPAERRLVAADGAASDDFGFSLAVDGALVLVGSPGHQADRGAAYVFDASDGSQLTKLLASDGAGGDLFGYSVALDGDQTLVGALNARAAYLFQLNGTGASTFEEAIYTSSSPTNISFGGGVALAGRLAVVSLVIGIELFDTASGESIHWLGGFPFGPTNFSLFGNTLFTANPVATDRDGRTVGAAFAYSPFAGPLALRKVAAVGDPVGVVPDTVYRAFGTVVAESVGQNAMAAFQAALAGPGSNRGRDNGVFGGTVAVSRLDLEARLGTGNGYDGLKIGSLGSPIRNEQTRGLFMGTVQGPGVNRTNGSVLFSGRESVLNLRALVRSGVTTLGGGEVIGVMSQVVQNRERSLTTGGRFALAHNLLRGPGGVGLASDSGVIFARTDPFAVLREVAREGDPVPVFGGGTYGQFLGRVTMNHPSIYSYPAYWTPTGGTIPIQGIFSDTEGGPGGDFARQGHNAPGWPGRSLGVFLAEAMNPNGWFLYRATMTGPDVNRTNNEGLWNGNVGSVVAKGEQGGAIDGLPDGTITRILSFWPSRDDNTVEGAIVLLQLAGPGINRNNDIVLMLFEDGWEPQVLLREGQRVSESDGARVGVIQRVDVDPVSGDYVVLASLTGSAAMNQALFTGDTAAGDPDTHRVLRQPFLRLRKGRLHTSVTSAVTGIRSMSLSPLTDRGGAGGKGGGQAIGATGRIATVITFDNRVTELMEGEP